MKKATVIIAIAMTLSIISGCGEYGINNEAELVKMVSYINERYEDDSFVFRSRNNAYGSGVSRGMPGCLVDSEKYPDADILVRLSSTGAFLDNYLYYKYEEQEDAYLKNILDEVFNKDYRLYIYASESSHLIGMDSISADASFEEYMKNSRKFLRFEVVVSPDYIINDKNDLAKMLSDTFTSLDITISIATISFCMNQEDYESLPEGIIRSPAEYYRRKKHEPFLSMKKLDSGEREFVWEEAR
ncbi:MAG: hypothetical protein FWH55_05120 [Oscillospiraceae bacterium]|nr:hypothetical protein [Oscillospiraceae bacterium]